MRNEKVPNWLAEVLTELPERQRLTVEMSLQGYTQQESAEQLQTSREAVAGLLRRALEHLRLRWQQLRDGPG